MSVVEGSGSPVAPAELCWALIMAASRHLPAYITNLSAGYWQQSGSLALGRTLSELTLGIWGYGKIGQRIAQYTKAFSMQVLVWGSESSRDLAREHGFKAAATKADFFANADIVSIHLRLNDVTWGIIKHSDLALMKPDSLFVNTSRADLVETNALFNEMSTNPTKRAAINVFQAEPATATNEPLITLANVLCTPHIGYVETNSYELYFKTAFENVIAFAEGRPQNLVTR